MKRSLIWVLSVIVLSFFSASAAHAVAPAVPTPALVAPAADEVMTTSLPVITGLAHSDLTVAVYIDDVFNGYADIVSDENGVASFAYEPFLPLTAGTHTVMVRAEDRDAGTRSDKGEVRTFTVAHKLPTATVTGTVVNDDASATRPYIVGVAPAGTTVAVSVDGVSVGTTTATDDESGTGSFAIRSTFELNDGRHWVRATASEPTGLQRVSVTSGPTGISVSAPATAAEDSSSETDAQTETPTEELTNTDNTSQNNTAEEAATAEEAPADDSANEMVADDGSQEQTDESPADESAESEEDTADEDDGEGAAATTEEDDENNTLEVLGWLALLVVAATVVARARRRRRGDSTDVSFSPSTESKDSGDGNGNNSQLDLKAPKENNNITVIKHDDSSDSTS